MEKSGADPLDPLFKGGDGWPKPVDRLDSKQKCSAVCTMTQVLTRIESMAQTPEQMAAAMVANMKEKTGMALPEWVEIARASGEAKHGAIVKHLKGEHGMTHGYANLVAHEFLASAAGDSAPDDLVANQYSAKKAGLRPIYDRIAKAVGTFGKDVELAPKKAYVSLRRSKQFALVQPSTATRVDVGINLKGDDPIGRLEKSGSFNSMVSHRVRIASAAEVDEELIAWLREAYERA